MGERWMVIINPNAGRRKGEKDWPTIDRLLRQKGFSFHYAFSQYPRHAIEIARKSVEQGYRKIMAVGGDGTINEVVNGVFLQSKVPTNEVSLAVIPVGTGNDWGKMFQISGNYQQVVDIIARGKWFLQDAGIVDYHNGDVKHSRYFINIAGIGFDALVAKKTNSRKQKGKSSPLSYLLALFSSLLKYNSCEAEIVAGPGNKVNTSLFSMNVGICRYNGGGMKQTPNAIPDDGLFDLTIIRKVKKRRVIRHVAKIYKGSHLSLPYVSTLRTHTVSITSPTPMNLEVDGESLGHTPLEFSIIPSSIKVIVA